MDRAIPSTVPVAGERPYPFLLALVRCAPKAAGFVPDAFVVLSADLAACGLLDVAQGEDLKALLVLLSLVSPNGDWRVTAGLFAEALRTSEAVARSSLRRLAALGWHGQPLVFELISGSGLVTYHPAPALVGTLGDIGELRREDVLPVTHGSREAVIAHSRKRYAKPRLEVEREIAAMNGWPDPETAALTQAPVPIDAVPEDPDRKVARDRLRLLGLSRDRADALVARYGAGAVLRQLDWLTYRHAKSPARLIVAALEHGYGEPLAARARGAESPAPAGEEQDA